MSDFNCLEMRGVGSGRGKLQVGRSLHGIEEMEGQEGGVP